MDGGKMNIVYYHTTVIKRAYEVQPGEIVRLLGIQYKVMRVNKDIILKSMKGKELSGIPITISANSKERIEVIGLWPVTIQNRKRKYY